MTILRVAFVTTLLAFCSLAFGQAGVARVQTEVDHFATRSLELAFSTKSAGAAAIRTYELHYTTDGGRTWQPHPDRHGQPDAFPFTAPADGRYGFSIVAIDAAGNRSDVPQPGERPAYTCVIDTVPPALTGADLEGPGLGPGPLRAELRPQTRELAVDAPFLGQVERVHDVGQRHQRLLGVFPRSDLPGRHVEPREPARGPPR
ncbi:MAG: hypothetical protein AAF488_06575, partial [Planctomycetota bacterium]